MSREILLLVDALAREKNVPKETVFGALESALAMATKKLFAEDDVDCRSRVTRSSCRTRASRLPTSSSTSTSKSCCHDRKYRPAGASRRTPSR